MAAAAATRKPQRLGDVARSPIRTGGGEPAPSDTVPAQLTPGETVITKDLSQNALAPLVELYQQGQLTQEAIEQYLYPILQNLSADTGEGYAQGGLVSLVGHLFGGNPNVNATKADLGAMANGSYQGQAAPPSQPVNPHSMGNSLARIANRTGQIDQAVDRAGNGYELGGEVPETPWHIRQINQRNQLAYENAYKPATQTWTTASGLQGQGTALTPQQPVNRSLVAQQTNPNLSTGMAGKQLVAAPKAPFYEPPPPNTINVPPGGFSQPADKIGMDEVRENLAKAKVREQIKANLPNNGMGGNAPPVGPPNKLNIPVEGGAPAAAASRLAGVLPRVLGGLGMALYPPAVGEGSDVMPGVDNQAWTNSPERKANIAKIPPKPVQENIQRNSTIGRMMTDNIPFSQPPKTVADVANSQPATQPTTQNADYIKSIEQLGRDIAAREAKQPQQQPAAPAPLGMSGNNRVSYSQNDQGGINKTINGKTSPLTNGITPMPNGVSLPPGNSIEFANNYINHMKGDSFLGKQGPVTAAQKLDAYNRLTGQAGQVAGGGLPVGNAPLLQEPSQWAMDTAAWNATHGAEDGRKTDKLRYANLLDQQQRARTQAAQGRITPHELMQNQTEQQKNALALAEINSNMDYRNRHLGLQMARLGNNDNPANDYLKGLYDELGAARQAGDTAKYDDLMQKIQQVNPPKGKQADADNLHKEFDSTGAERYFSLGANGEKQYVTSVTPNRVNAIKGAIEVWRKQGVSDDVIRGRITEQLAQQGASLDEWSPLLAQWGFK